LKDCSKINFTDHYMEEEEGKEQEEEEGEEEVKNREMETYM
jgi:hypothetical protein